MMVVVVVVIGAWICLTRGSLDRDGEEENRKEERERVCDSHV